MSSENSLHQNESINNKINNIELRLNALEQKVNENINDNVPKQCQQKMRGVSQVKLSEKTQLLKPNTTNKKANPKKNDDNDNDDNDNDDNDNDDNDNDNNNNEDESNNAKCPQDGTSNVIFPSKIKKTSKKRSASVDPNDALGSRFQVHSISNFSTKSVYVEENGRTIPLEASRFKDRKADHWDSQFFKIIIRNYMQIKAVEANLTQEIHNLEKKMNKNFQKEIFNEKATRIISCLDQKIVKVNNNLSQGIVALGTKIDRIEETLQSIQNTIQGASDNDDRSQLLSRTLLEMANIVVKNLQNKA